MVDQRWVWRVVAVVAGIFGSAAAAAGEITVTTIAPGVNNDGECSLREAIYPANLDASKAPDPAHLGDSQHSSIRRVRVLDPYFYDSGARLAPTTSKGEQR